MSSDAAPTWLRFLSGPDVDDLAITSVELVDAVEAVLAAHSPGSTSEGADICVEASRLEEPAPLVRREQLGPGSLLVPNGTVSALEPDILQGVDKVVVDDWRESQSGRFGALRAQVDSGELSADTVHAQIGQVVTGERPARESDDERIVFWHRGLSILDVAVGELVLRRAEARDVGTMVRYR